MSRLIDADDLKQLHGMKDDCADCEKEIKGKVKSCEYDRVYTLMDFCGWIDDMPTIEPERKTGRWIPQNHNKVNGMTSTAVYYYPKCSVCGHCANYTNFCPACGADMRGEQNG